MSLVDKATGQHPVFMGPSMIHLKKDFETYLKFAQEIKAFDLTHLNKLDFKIIVTDDDAALHNAFKTVFPKIFNIFNIKFSLYSIFHFIWFVIKNFSRNGE